MVTLGINAYHGDASACLLIDGKLVSASEEERFRRIKHWAGLPSEAIKSCLQDSGLSLEDVDYIAINRDPKANLVRKIIYGIMKRANFDILLDRLKNASKVNSILSEICTACNVNPINVRAKIIFVEHHLAHLGSSFLVSPFASAAVVSVDGFGDFASTMWGEAHENKISVKDRIHYPHSLGLFYLAITQYLGFMNYGDEYKVMGLAPYGKPIFQKEMRQMVRLLSKGRFELNLSFFSHHDKGVVMQWEHGEPVIDRVFTKSLEVLLGPARKKEEPLLEKHWDIAASAQAMYEEAFFHLLNYVQTKTGQTTLALAGGCAMNSVANGKIFECTNFRNLYIQSAAGDAGGAIGAAFVLQHQIHNEPRKFVMEHAYWGPKFTNQEIESLLKQRQAELENERCSISLIENEKALTSKIAQKISEGLVIGWFQGRMEWGPRALGNRSILGDPRRSDMKDILNLKIKKRESFRPFAPSILREQVSDWFETDCDVPFMLQVFQIRQDKQKLIPAVTHVNGSGRLQTVRQDQNQRYYQLIESFYEQTGVPILLNTSFNENEPVVCRPEEALNCFLRTKMDILVMNDYVIERVA